MRGMTQRAGPVTRPADLGEPLHNQVVRCLLYPMRRVLPPESPALRDGEGASGLQTGEGPRTMTAADLQSRAEVIVIGGGPAGSTAANLLAQRGIQVTLLEKTHHPRF